VKEPESLAHSRALELMPWFVNGTLTGAERDAVEQHTRACIACRRELREQQRLHAAVRARRTVDVSAEAGFDRLDAELDRAEAPVGPRRRLSYASVAPFAVTAAAGVAVLAILVWLTPLPELGADDYTTLTTSAADAAVLDIVFADDATAADMQRLLDEIGGEIVAGPSTLGRYSVRLARAQTGSAQLGELLEDLASDPRVRFAGRALTDVEP
jgi:hypothetical protein